MFWHKKPAEEEKLPKPGLLPGLVSNYLIKGNKVDANLALILKGVWRKSTSQEGAFDIRIYDESELLAKKVQIDNYTSLDGKPDLILYEGWFNGTSKQVELQEKKKLNCDTPVLTQDEIQKKMEALTEPGSKTFVYLARGTAHGGPCAMGAAVIELNPDYPGPKQKKYNLYIADVIDMQPVSVGKDKWLFGADKPKDIASWVKERHGKREY